MNFTLETRMGICTGEKVPSWYVRKEELAAANKLYLYTGGQGKARLGKSRRVVKDTDSLDVPHPSEETLAICRREGGQLAELVRNLLGDFVAGTLPNSSHAAWVLRHQNGRWRATRLQ